MTQSSSGGRGDPPQTPPADNAGEGADAGLLRAGFVVSSMTMLSRVLGLVRDMVIANFFGAGGAADAFFLAFRIPNLFRRLFAEGAFAQAFVPVLAEYRSQRSVEAVRAFVAAVSGTLGVTLLAFTALGVAAAPLLIQVFAAGFVYHGYEEKLALATDMLRITFPYLFFIALTAFAGAVLNTYQRFAPPAFAPVLLNLALIGSAIWLRDAFEAPVIALAWGVFVAGIAQLLLQMPFLARIGQLPVPRVDFGDAGVRRVLRLMVPALFAVSVGQINLLLDTILASFLETGSLSWLYYSDRLLELPLALFAIAIATVILPNLSRDHAEADPEAFNRKLNWGLRVVMLLGVPASAALVVLARPLIGAIFYQGAMTARDVDMAGLALQAYGVGLVGLMLVKVLAPGYFARQDTATPVRYGIVALTSNMVLNLILVWPLAHAGLALATGLAAFVNAGLLFGGLRRAGVFRALPGWPKLIAQITFATAGMVVSLVWLTPGLDVWLDLSLVPRLGLAAGVCTVGMVVYGALLLLVGIRPSALRA
ncbi:MAG: murein biosynthesis integral membrane protein MurJ [Gammaproteobacteria bacterium]|nr:murein biosynthesis integral membrane protein MurJ [Gammaproteobacteria bacterium]